MVFWRWDSLSRIARDKNGKYYSSNGGRGGNKMQDNFASVKQNWQTSGIRNRNLMPPIPSHLLQIPRQSELGRTPAPIEYLFIYTLDLFSYLFPEGNTHMKHSKPVYLTRVVWEWIFLSTKNGPVPTQLTGQTCQVTSSIAGKAHPESEARIIRYCSSLV